MARGRTYTTEALIIRCLPFGETSQIVHLSTPQAGRVTAMAKGSLRPGPSFRGGLALGQLGTAHLRVRKGAELELLTRYVMDDAFRGITQDVARYRGALYILDLLRAWVQPALPLPALHQAAVATLRVMARAPQAQVGGWVAWFEARALAATGHRPVLTTCAACDEDDSVPTWFDPGAGGLIHGPCRVSSEVLRLPEGARESLQHLYTVRLSDLAREPLTSAEVRDIRQVHDRFIPYVLERRPVTLAGVPGRR